jgi:hypothetical protein
VKTHFFHHFQLYLTFHSYGQYILYPWGYARKDAVDRNDLHRMAQIGAKAAQAKSGRKYTTGSAAKMLYPAAGKLKMSCFSLKTASAEADHHVFCRYTNAAGEVRVEKLLFFVAAAVPIS